MAVKAWGHGVLLGTPVRSVPPSRRCLGNGSGTVLRSGRGNALFPKEAFFAFDAGARQKAPGRLRRWNGQRLARMAFSKPMERSRESLLCSHGEVHRDQHEAFRTERSRRSYTDHTNRVFNWNGSVPGVCSACGLRMKTTRCTRRWGFGRRRRPASPQALRRRGNAPVRYRKHATGHSHPREP
jgi:hypothetical protein